MDKSYQIPAGFLNRSMLREQADVTEHELKALEGSGKVKAVRRNSYGWRLYSASDVERVRKLAEELRAKRHGRPHADDVPRLTPAYQEPVIAYSLEQYRAVYTQIEKGIAVDKIPMHVDVHPSVVTVILKDAKHLAGAFIVAKPIADAINKIPFRDIGAIRSGDDLLEAFEKLSEANEALKPPVCQAVDADDKPCEKPAKLCLGCAKRHAPKSALTPADGTATLSSPAPKLPKLPKPPKLDGRTRTRRRREREAPPPTNGSAPT